VTSVETYVIYCLPFFTFFACSEILFTLEECSAQYVLCLFYIVSHSRNSVLKGTDHGTMWYCLRVHGDQCE